MSNMVGDIKINLTIPVQLFKEGKYFIMHSPALDVATQGKTIEEVKRRFPEAVEIFLEETIKMGTLIDILKDLGWTLKEKELNPPEMISQEIQSFNLPQIAEAE